MIQIEEASKFFGAQTVFRDLTWHITRGQRVGLVGPNGAGKTTVCRILMGDMEVDAGQVRRAKTTTIGYLPQEIAPAGDGTALGHVLAGYPDIQRLESELEFLASEMAEAENGTSHELMHRYGDLQHRYEALGGYGLEARAKAILDGLGFSADAFHAPLATLSGGWRMRVALGRLLLQSPDLLLLDEPTNHLDLESLQWIEDFLAAYEGTVVIISHDRYFLNRVVDRIAEGKVKEYYATFCLLEQPFVKDPKLTVGQLVQEKIAVIKENIVLRRFVRYRLGEETAAPQKAVAE